MTKTLIVILLLVVMMFIFGSITAKACPPAQNFGYQLQQSPVVVQQSPVVRPYGLALQQAPVVLQQAPVIVRDARLRDRVIIRAPLVRVRIQ